jgi:hypothetical protein
MNQKDTIDYLLSQINFREPIYIIESPSAKDLYEGRNEGDALTRMLQLANIETSYHLVTDAEIFDQAFSDIASMINTRSDVNTIMPFVHISAHGSDDGIELTDNDVIEWGKLNKSFLALHEKIGPIPFGEEVRNDVPKTTLCLSSCSALKNYKKNLPDAFPFQAILGPTIDIGWCQSLIGYSTFYYQNFIRNVGHTMAVKAMNSASSSPGETIFEMIHDANHENLMKDLASAMKKIINAMKSKPNK